MRIALFPILLLAALVLLILIATDDAYGNRASVKATICEVFGPRCGPALRVAYCETGGTYDPRARGRAGELSIFQIHPIHFWRTVRSSAGRIYVNPRRLHDVLYASRVAFVMSRGGTDWRPWSACI